MQAHTDKFDEFITTSDVPVLVDFYADWCAPCKMMTPILKDLKSTWGDKIKIIKAGNAVHRTSGVLPLARLQAEYGRFI